NASGRSSAEARSFFEKAGATAVVLNFSDDDIAAINRGESNLWAWVDVPANSYSGQAATQQTIGIGNFLGANAEVDEDVAYQVTKAIFDNLPFLRELDQATTAISIENTFRTPAIAPHPGAETYYREVGITLPAPEPIRVSNLAERPFLRRFETVGDARARLANATITVLGGQAGETVDRVINELSVGLGESDIRVIGMTSPTPANDVADVLYAKGVDSAVVPLDILNYARDRVVYPEISDKLVYATEMFPQEFHLIVNDTIGNIDDLIDKQVNIGPGGSSTEFTASFLFDALNLPIEPTFHDSRKALELLKSGDIAAAVFVAGSPMRLLREIGRDDGLRPLAVPPLEGRAYRSATISDADYPAMLAPGEAVETFSVRSVLITYDWRSENPRYRAVSTFVTALFDQLPLFQDGTTGFHAKWRDIDPTADIEGWRRFPAAENWLRTWKRSGAAPIQNGG
ncbi:MAG: TAXI family TRAP transporter solute-binding subunit, partial [Geminicoccaceae bacterium]